jgi:triacylglycerol lipase
MARNRVTYNDQTGEACNVVLLPPPEAIAAVVVVLPQEATVPPGELQRWATSDHAPPLVQLLQKVQGTAGRHLPIYYLACVALDGQERQAELALAATALGWPAGHFVLLPTEAKDTQAAVLSAVDRLRWLFAGTLDLWLLNLEPALTAALRSPLEAQPDRADVQLLSGSSQEPSQRARGGALRRLVPRPTRAVLLPRHPIVFCHGMLAYSFLKMQMPEHSNYFAPLHDYFRQRGFRVFFPQVAATGGVVERARQLREQIQRWTDEPVNLIAHSMGGLDARYLIANLGMADQVRSLTTICTPHRGSYLADWFSDHFRERVPLLLALEAFGVNLAGFNDLKLEACKEFNRTTPDMPQVRYFSYGGEVSPARLTPFLRRGWSLLSAVEGPNDGLVSVASARWGEYLGTILADHFAQTPDAVFLRDGENFDSLGFFSRLVEDLARRGF